MIRLNSAAKLAELSASTATDPAMTEKKPVVQSATLEAWNKAAAKSAPGGNVEALNWITPDGIAVKPLYTAADTADLAHADTLPGFEPY